MTAGDRNPRRLPASETSHSENVLEGTLPSCPTSSGPRRFDPWPQIRLLGANSFLISCSLLLFAPVRLGMLKRPICLGLAVRSEMR